MDVEAAVQQLWTLRASPGSHCMAVSLTVSSQLLEGTDQTCAAARHFTATQSLGGQTGTSDGH